MKKQIILIMIVLLLNNLFTIYSIDKIDDLSFSNTEITQVLKTISEIFEITIVPDREIQGNITRYFKDTTLEQTLTLLLEPLDYIYIVKDSIYFVKKKPNYQVNFDDQKQVFTIIANRAKVSDIINEMSLKSEQTIMFEGNENDIININIFEKKLDEALSLLTKSINYDLKQEGTSFKVSKVEKEDEWTDIRSDARFLLKGDENNIAIKLKNLNSNDIIIKLFQKYNKKLSLLSKKSIRIPYLDIENVTFDDLLFIVFQHSKQAFTKEGETYHVYDSLSSQHSNPYRITRTYKLKNLTYKTFSLTVPSQIIPQTSYKINAETNELLIYGSPDEVNLYYSYIEKIDLAQSQYEYRVFNLVSIDVKRIKSYLPEKFQKLNLSIIDAQNMFSVFLNNEDYAELASYLDIIDTRATQEYAYKFNYLNPEDVMKSMIPSNVDKKNIILNKNNSSLIFTLTKEQHFELFEYFDSIDVPNSVQNHDCFDILL